jgi:nicotinamide-nucleotide amidase
MKAWILSIGNELLNGHTLNTNATFIAENLFNIGIDVTKIICTSDNKNEILAILNEAYKETQLVIATGGLGPTTDDISKDAFCQFFNQKLVFNKNVWHNIGSLFSKRNIPISELNKKQALVPEDAIVLKNQLGTAPGLVLRKNKFVLIALPGIPFEMKHIFENEVIPYINKNFEKKSIYNKTFLFSGISESLLAEKLYDIDNILRKNNINIAYLPQPGIIKLKLYYKNKCEEDKLINNFISFVNTYLFDYLIYDDDISLQEILGLKLIQANKTICTAESCTGGFIAHQITSIPGSSKYFLGSIVAYSNEIKTSVLKIPSVTIKKYGSVSKEVVEIMAINARNMLKSDYSVAVSGIAGPDGGTKEKPVGTTWIAIAGNNFCISEKFIFGNCRIANIERTSNTAFVLLIKELNKIIK